MSLTAFPSNIDVSPSNWQDIALVKDFTKMDSGVSVGVVSDASDVDVQFQDFRLTREGFVALLDWVNNQGRIFENVPATFTSPGGQIYNLFLDLREGDFGLDDAVTGVRMRKSGDHFFEKMEFLTFSLLRSEGFITDEMLLDFPYLIVPDNLRENRAIQLATLAALLFQLYITAKEIADLVALILNPTNLPVVLAQAISIALFLALTISSLINTAVKLQELYFPFLRYYKCISDYDLMSAACAWAGYAFVSDFMTNERAGVYTIGKPDIVTQSVTDKLDNFFTNQYFNDGYPRSTDTGGANAKALFDDYLSTYDIEIFIYNGVVRMERSSYFDQNSNVTVKPTYTDQSAMDDRYAFNFGQSWGRKFNKWSDDGNDVHSREINKGDVKFEAITTANNPINEDLVNLTGLKEYQSPFALVKRKNDFTGVELFVQDIIQAIESTIISMTGQFAVNPNFNISSLITKRLGVGIFEKDNWTTTRKVWGFPEVVDDRIVIRQPEDFLDYMSQTKIDEIFNTGLRVKNNFYRNKTFSVKFNDENFINLLQNNRIAVEGEPEKAKVLLMKWYPYRYEVELDIELSSNAADNTTTTIL